MEMDKSEDNSSIPAEEAAKALPAKAVIRPPELDDYTLLELRTLLDKTAMELGRYWSQWLRDRIVVVLDRVESHPWKNVKNRFLTLETRNSQPTPQWYSMSFHSDVVGAQDIIVFPAAMLSNMFDRLTGGQAAPEEISSLGVSLTVLEQRLLNRVAESFAQQWESAWSKILPLNIQSVEQAENLPLEESDPVAVCEFTLRWDKTNLSFYLIIPYFAVWDIQQRIDRSHLDWVSDFNSQTNAVPEGIRKAKIRLSVCLAQTTLTAEEFVQMQAGDIITTDQKTDAPIEVLLQGQPKFQASPGQLQGQKAIEIIE